MSPHFSHESPVVSESHDSLLVSINLSEPQESLVVSTTLMSTHWSALVSDSWGPISLMSLK